MKKLHLLFSALFLFGTLTMYSNSLSVTANVVTNVSCYGGSNGSVSATATGGTSPYTYLWSPSGGTNSTATGLTATAYTITVTDYVGNTATASVTITQPTAALSTTASASASTVCPGNSVSLYSTATSGGTAPYTYTWNSGVFGDLSCSICGTTITTFPFGSAYTLTTVDINGCNATSSVSITVLPFPYVSVTGPLSPISSGSPDTLIASGASTYLWSTGATTSQIIVNPLSSTTYTVGGTNSFGCQDTTHYTVSINTSGNGSSHTNAISITPITSCALSSYSTLDSEVWFSFVPSDSNDQIVAQSAYMGIPAPHVHRLTLYNNSMTILQDEHLPDMNGAYELRIDASHLTIGNTYYVRAARTPSEANMPGCNPNANRECNASMRWSFQLGVRTLSIFVPNDSAAEPPSMTQLNYENRGQIQDMNGISRFDVKTYANNAWPALYCSDSLLSFVYCGTHPNPSVMDTFQRVDMVPTGSYVQAPERVFKMEEDTSAGYLNYFLGFVPNGITDVYGYSRIVYKNIYSNIDMHVYSNNEGTKLYFVCNPGSGGGTGGSGGGNPADIELEFRGANSVNVTGGGGLKVVTDFGTLSFAPGFAYTDSAGIVKAKSWQAYFISVSSTVVKFNTGSYNTAEPLVIEVDRGKNISGSNSCNKNICWSTFCGGANQSDAGSFKAVTHDHAGNIYAAGYTTAAKFPVFNGIYTKNKGDNDAVIIDFSGSNYARNWATYYGGSEEDSAKGIGVDFRGSVYVTGNTNSIDFPVVQSQFSGYFQSNLNGTGSGPNTDVFIVQLNAGGKSVAWATYYGGVDNESGNSLAVTYPNPNATEIYIAGSGDANTPLYTESGANNYSTGYGLIIETEPYGFRHWVTLIGPASNTVLNGCTVDSNNNFYVTGAAGSGYPVSGGCFTNEGGASDAIATKFTTGGAIVWSTYYGGDGADVGNAITTDAYGNAYITGYTFSPGNNIINIELAKPHSWSYYQPANGGWDRGVENVFIAEFAPSDGSLLWGTYFGELAATEGYAITTDSKQDVYITGYSTEIGPSEYGFVYPGHEPYNAYVWDTTQFFFSQDNFLAAFNADQGYYWGTLLGGAIVYNDVGFGVTAYNDQNLYVVGNTASYPYIFINPGGGAWFQDTNIQTTGTTNIPLITEFDLSGIATGTEKLTVNNGQLQVYPNPTLQDITMEMNLTGRENIEVSVLNLLGETVFTENFIEQEGTFAKQIPIASLPAGLYIIRAKAGDNIYYNKIVKLQ